MKGFVVGLLIGLSATMVCGQTISGWLTGANLLEGGSDTLKGAMRLGYVAGAFDMLSAVIESSPALGQAELQRQYACLKERSGGGLGQLEGFAENLWRGRNVQAASILLTEACK
jgi:hypothetical protein